MQRNNVEVDKLHERDKELEAMWMIEEMRAQVAMVEPTNISLTKGVR